MIAYQLDALARSRIDDVYDDIAGEARDLPNVSGQIGAQIGFGQQDRGRWAAPGRPQQDPLQSPQVVIAAGPHHYEHHIDVCGHHLFPRGFPRRATSKGAAARQHGENDAAIFGGAFADGDPVTDCGQFGAARRAVLQTPCRDRVEFAVVHVNTENLIELDRNAAWLNVFLRLPWLVGGSKSIVPSEIRQHHRCAASLCLAARSAAAAAVRNASLHSWPPSKTHTSTRASIVASALRSAASFASVYHSSRVPRPMRTGGRGTGRSSMMSGGTSPARMISA